MEPILPFRSHKTPPLDPALNQLDSIHTLIYYIFEINFNIMLPSMPIFTQGIFPLRLKLCINHRPVRATCLVHCFPWFDHDNNI
jgi:hypothetical protein